MLDESGKLVVFWDSSSLLKPEAFTAFLYLRSFKQNYCKEGEIFLLEFLKRLGLILNSNAVTYVPKTCGMFSFLFRTVPVVKHLM